MKIAVLFLLIAVIGAIAASKMPRTLSRCVKKVWRGCRVRPNGKCYCKSKSACINPFIYPSKKICRRMHRNVCKLQQPCQNGGFCQPIKRRRYKCQCTGTGFYGTNCETVCPEPNPMDTQFWRFPQDCIFI